VTWAAWPQPIGDDRRLNVAGPQLGELDLGFGHTNALNSEVIGASSKGMKAFAIGPLEGQTSPNVNVIVTSTAGSPSGKAFAPAAVGAGSLWVAFFSRAFTSPPFKGSRQGEHDRHQRLGRPDLAGPAVWTGTEHLAPPRTCSSDDPAVNAR
jgi:hypothetical protein